MALCLLFLISPGAFASAGTGEFGADGPLHFAGPATTTMVPVAIAALNTAGIKSFDLSAQGAEVCWFERRELNINDGTLTLVEYPGVVSGCYRAANVSVHLTDGDQAGLVGFYPRSGATATGPMSTLEPRSNTQLRFSRSNDTPIQAQADTPDFPYYNQNVLQPNILSKTSRANIQGAGAVKVNGPDIIVTTGNETTFRTGTYPETSSNQEVIRWVVISYETSMISLEVADGVQIVGRVAPRIEFEHLTFTPTSGSFVSDTERYDAMGNQADLVGSFIGSAAPSADGSTFDLHVRGEVDEHSTTLASVAIRAPLPANEFVPWGLWLGVGLAAVVVTGGAAYLVVLRKPESSVNRPQALDGLLESGLAATYEERAESAADAGEWASAADFFGRARRLEPRRPLIAQKQGMALLADGQLREALASFQDATSLSDDGEAERWAAICLIRLDDEEVARLMLLSGLRRNMRLELLDEIESEREFSSILADPAVRREIQQARERDFRASLR